MTRFTRVLYLLTGFTLGILIGRALVTTRVQPPRKPGRLIDVYDYTEWKAG